MLNILKKWGVFLIILILTIVESIPLLHSGYYTSHDGAGHLARLVDYDQALHDGQIPVRIAHKVEFGIGYPYFYFNYPLPYILAEGFHLGGGTFVDSWKAVGFLSFFLSGAGMFLFLKQRLDKISSLFGAISYMFIPYHFANVYVRGNFPEALALSLVPWLFASADRLKGKGKVSWFGLIFGLFILSHNTTVAIFSPVVFLYLILTNYPIFGKIWKKAIVGFFIGVGISAFFWLPALIYEHDIIISILRLDYPNNFIHPDKLIYSPWSFGGSNVGVEKGVMSLQIGIAFSLIFFLGTTLLMYKMSSLRKKETFVWPLFFFFTVIFSIILMLDPTGRPFWQYLSFLQTLQFPWRLLGLTTFSISCLGAWLISESGIFKIRLLLSIFLLSVLFYAARNQIRVNEYTSPDLNYQVYPQSSTAQEHLPIWSSRDFLKQSEWNGTVLAGGTSQRTVWNSNLHEFSLFMETDGFFRDNTVYMPGWNVYVDGKVTEVKYLEPNSLGRLMVYISSGAHQVVSKFRETGVDFFADMVSLISLILLIVSFKVKIK